jgi:hypothetical protein
MAPCAIARCPGNSPKSTAHRQQHMLTIDINPVVVHIGPFALRGMG